jgi:hypothetical protein
MTFATPMQALARGLGSDCQSLVSCLGTHNLQPLHDTRTWTLIRSAVLPSTSAPGLQRPWGTSSRGLAAQSSTCEEAELEKVANEGTGVRPGS